MPLTALRPTLLGALTPALALLLGLSPTGATALGLGRPQIHSALGGPLDASIPLSLADGERLTDACLRAEVSAGEARMPAGLLQLRVEGEPGQQRIRLQSLVGIDEPTLRVTLALGCPSRLTREFNLFIDPPVTAVPAVTVPDPQPAPPPPMAAAPLPRTVAEATPPPAPAPRPRPRPRPKASGPRLVLERPEVLVAEAPRPVQRAASAPATELTPELEAQIARLEETVAQLRAELQAREAAVAASAAQPAAGVAASAPGAVQSPRVSPYRDPMTWLLTLGLGLLAGSAAFYGSRWRDERARRELAYWRAVQAAESAALPPPMPSPGMAPPVVGDAAPLPDEGQHQIARHQPQPMPWAPPADVAQSMLATQPLPVQPTMASVSSPQLAPVEELLDLQQQVDFLLLLGQHEAAADLLSECLARGDVGAMPHLMLMELCQQRGEPEMFAEAARQYTERLGMPAPPWSQSLSNGRSLEDSPSVIAHLQVVWSEPAAAVQMLQELLARGAGPGTPHFELPAYRELLVLYSVARDLLEIGLRNHEVDLMLPIDTQAGGLGA